jgi:SAM-dependent methyltransferase
VPAYSHVAFFYDHLMRHVNYPRWAQYVIDLFRLAKEKPVERVLELACGTGKMLVELSQAGYMVYGLDSSLAMLEMADDRLSEARNKKHRIGGKLEPDPCPRQAPALPVASCSVWCGDMRNFALASEVDAAICLYDSFNYCLEPDDARQLLANVAKAVRRGGVFIFDVCTHRNCRKNFRNYYERDHFGEFSYIRRAYYKPYRRIQINEFIITNEMAGGPPLYERHEQRIYFLREIRNLIDTGQWSLAGCFDGMSRRPGTEKSNRVHFVLRRV